MDIDADGDGEIEIVSLSGFNSILNNLQGRSTTMAAAITVLAVVMV